MSDMIHRKWHH